MAYEIVSYKCGHENRFKVSDEQRETNLIIIKKMECKNCRKKKGKKCNKDTLLAQENRPGLTWGGYMYNRKGQESQDDFLPKYIAKVLKIKFDGFFYDVFWQFTDVHNTKSTFLARTPWETVTKLKNMRKKFRAAAF